jgi:hypothetical protein
LVPDRRATRIVAARVGSDGGESSDIELREGHSNRAIWIATEAVVRAIDSGWSDERLVSSETDEGISWLGDYG